jgi:hypothetical protein
MKLPGLSEQKLELGRLKLLLQQARFLSINSASSLSSSPCQTAESLPSILHGGHGGFSPEDKESRSMK